MIAYAAQVGAQVMMLVASTRTYSNSYKSRMRLDTSSLVKKIQLS